LPVSKFFTLGLFGVAPGICACGVGHGFDDAVCGKSSGSKGSDVSVAGDIGPMFLEDALAEAVDFTEGDGGMSCSLKTSENPMPLNKSRNFIMAHTSHQKALLSRWPLAEGPRAQAGLFGLAPRALHFLTMPRAAPLTHSARCKLPCCCVNFGR
jgi:hypothetical protein